MVGLFWFAWTSFPSISPWPQILAGAPIGFGIMLITLQGMNYVIDCYAMYANSALAANTSIRYCLAAGFPLFAEGMFHNLGVSLASSSQLYICINGRCSGTVGDVCAWVHRFGLVACALALLEVREEDSEHEQIRDDMSNGDLRPQTLHKQPGCGKWCARPSTSKWVEQGFVLETCWHGLIERYTPPTKRT